MAELRIGTSGWHYKHWVGPFYPRGTKPKDFLSHYAKHFDTAEINNTFYRLPSKAAAAAWRGGTPRGFAFACKASRFITHMKKLKEPEETVARFFDVISGLHEKLGPVLFQLPPGWRANPARLDAFLSALPRRHRYAFEFRDPSWFTDEVYETLRRHKAAFCVYDLTGETAPMVITAPFAYIRLHGPGAAYRGRYSDRALDQWAGWIGEQLATGIDVYCYFDNDEAGHAPNDALRLKARLAE